jgi:hypothetical protein
MEVSFQPPANSPVSHSPVATKQLPLPAPAATILENITNIFPGIHFPAQIFKISSLRFSSKDLMWPVVGY